MTQLSFGDAPIPDDPGPPWVGRRDVVLVGELNPYGADPDMALYPYPPNSAGGRLCAILDLPFTKDYVDLGRVNLCDYGWSVRRARERAQTIALAVGPVGRWSDALVVLLGRKVADAFEEWTGPIETWRSVANFVSLPHPSGRCREWNDPSAPSRARRLLHELRPNIFTRES